MTKREKSQMVWEHIQSVEGYNQIARFARLFGLMEAYDNTEEAFDHYIQWTIIGKE